MAFNPFFEVEQQVLAAAAQTLSIVSPQDEDDQILSPVSPQDEDEDETLSDEGEDEDSGCVMDKFTLIILSVKNVNTVEKKTKEMASKIVIYGKVL